jgi:hypothetical protein
MSTIGDQYLAGIAQYTDINNLVKPQLAWVDSGNGLLYTAMDVILRDYFTFVDQRTDFQKLVYSCMEHPGLLIRTPQNTYGQESWDDYMGVAAACIVLGETEIPKMILGYAISHFFFMNNTGTFSWSAWLGRFPQIWILMWIAAFPIFKFMFFPMAYAISKFMSPTMGDTGSNNTDFCFMYALSSAYGQEFLDTFKSKMNALPMTLQANFTAYFSAAHPFSVLAQFLKP